jgi:tRNA (guanine-N7-)-methyltransferase
MGQKKLVRFTELLTFPNVFQYPKGMQGGWNQFFGNDFPVTLELACGKGEYSVGLGRMFPERNFIGIDMKGNRIWVGAKIAIKENLRNVAFIRSHIDKLTDYFSPQEISEIWLPFPDPQLRGSKAKKRLTHPKFLRLYQKVLTAGGVIHLKTDSPSLYIFTKKVVDLYKLTLLADIEDISKEQNKTETLNIQTHYESLDIAQSNKIHYLKFALPTQALPDKDAELKELLREETADSRN